jgi:GNAT superfamily N-acetyltransferase
VVLAALSLFARTPSRTQTPGGAGVGWQRPEVLMSEVRIRPVRPEDLADVVEMVHELAAYERAPESCRLTVPRLREALFTEQPALYGHVAVAVPGGEAPGPDDDRPRPVGFALWFKNFSTWEGSHGIYLEDLYVRPSARGTGVGRQLLAELAATCVLRGYPRLDWSVLRWNPARDFYHSIGAEAMDEWMPYRLAGPALTQLAETAPDQAGDAAVTGR